MRNIKLTIVAAVAAGLAISALEGSAFARGPGGAGGGGAGGGAGGSSGGGGAGAGSNPNMNPLVFNQPPLAVRPRRVVPLAHFNALSNPCYKYSPLYDRYGNQVAGWHSSECFGE